MAELVYCGSCVLFILPLGLRLPFGFEWHSRVHCTNCNLIGRRQGTDWQLLSFLSAEWGGQYLHRVICHGTRGPGAVRVHRPVWLHVSGRFPAIAHACTTWSFQRLVVMTVLFFVDAFFFALSGVPFTILLVVLLCFDSVFLTVLLFFCRPTVSIKILICKLPVSAGIC